MNWPTGQREFNPNATAEIVYTTASGEVRRVEPVRVSPKMIRTRGGDRFNPNTGQWMPRTSGRDFMKRGRWLASVTVTGEAARMFATARKEL